MVELVRTLSIEREMAANLARTREPREAIKICAEAIGTIVHNRGIFVDYSGFNEHYCEKYNNFKVLEHTNAVHMEAAETSDFYTGIHKGKTAPHIRISFGDDRGGRGSLVLVADEKISTSTACIIERMCEFLADTLRRLEMTKKLEALNRDHDLLLREIRHRNRNSLQLILNMLPLLFPGDSEIPSQICTDMEQRIGALLTLNSLFDGKDPKGRVNLQKYLISIIKTLRSFNVEGVGSLYADYTEIESMEIKREQAASIGLILHELVLNSLKHSSDPAPEMRVQFSLQEQALLMHYTDTPKKHEPSMIAENRMTYFSELENTGSGLGILEGLLLRAKGTRLEPRDKKHIFIARFELH